MRPKLGQGKVLYRFLPLAQYLTSVFLGKHLPDGE